MKKARFIFVLIVLLNTIHCFSQKVKEAEKFQSDYSQIAKINPDSKAYCSSTYSDIYDDYISNVTFNSINNYTGQEGPGSYGDYTFSHITGVVIGGTYTLSVTFYSGTYTQHVRAWFDWNDDDVFSASESYDLEAGISETKTKDITIPVGADLGDTRFRIIEQYSSDPGADGACDGMGNHTATYGETEDYTVVIFSNSYCQASGGCDEFIQVVEFPDHGYSYSSGCIGYVDFAPYWLIPVPINTSAYMTVVNGNGYGVDQCGIWVDWNRDNDFYDAYEEIPVNNTPSAGPYSATLVPPPGATLGECIVRIRITYNEAPVPCDPITYFYGEVEDYRINLLPKVPCTWTGAVDNNWHNPDNWNTIHIPSATDDVIIPDVTNKCWVYAGTAYCNNITVNFGSGNDLRIWNQDLYISGNMNMYGQLLMDHTDGKIITYGDVLWESGSRASIQADAYIEVHGDWIFKSGSNVTMNNGEVRFSGAGTYLRNFSSNSYFNNVVVYKASSEWLSISSNTTHDLRINGNLQITAGGTLYIYSPHSVILGGNLHSSGYLYCYDGNFIFDGNTQNISVQLGYSTTYQFNYLVLSSTTSTTILNKDITVSQGLTIESGQFIPNDHTINVGWYWYNQVGPAGFVEGNSTVRFFGTWDSEVDSDENFNTIEVDKVGNGFLNIWGPTVTCQHYNWTNGGISVREGGEFTVYDLIDNGLYGMWGVDNTGGTINVSNYGSGQWVDLNGYISLTGGTMNVYGESTLSYWPLSADAHIHMMDGVLDFHDQGIYITNYTPYTLTENITGGTIRTAGGFWGESSNFSPDYGTMEFYGGGDANIYTINGCYLNDVIINKSTKNASSTISQSINLVDEKSGKPIGNGTKSNTLTQLEFLDLNGSMTINNGVLNSNGYNIHVEEDWTNNVGDAGFMESTGYVAFVGYGKVTVIHTNETFNDLLLSNASGGIFGFTFMDGINIQVNNDLDIYNGALEMNYDSELHIGGDVYIALGGGLNADDGANILSVGGNWTNQNSSNTEYFGYQKGGEIVTFNGSGDQILNTDAPEETFGNIILNKSGGYFRPNDNIKIDGGLHIQNGDWWDNIGGLDHYLIGHVLIEADGGYFPLGTTSFKGLNYQTYQNNGGNAQFGDIIIDKHYAKNEVKGSALENDQEKTKAGTLELNSHMVIFNNHTTTIEEGTFDLNGNIFKSHGDIFINDGGELLVDEGAWLSIVASLYVNNGGQFTAAGVIGNNAHIWKDVVGYYDFQVKSGGTISANYTDFQDMNENGIWVQDGAFVDPGNCFNNCNFIDGINTSPSVRLVINTDQTLNINNINFNNNPYVAGAYNVGKAIYQGELIITTTGGDFTGPLYEYDPDPTVSRIQWTDYPPGRWTGNVSSDWFDPMNWGDFTVPGVASDVVIPAGSPNYPIVNNSIGQCSYLILETGASLEIGNTELHVGNIFDNYGHLVMTNSLAELHANIFNWLTGSTANINNGEFYCSVWTWGNGTNASLGTGNTVYIDWSIGQYDLDAAFGNLVLLSGQDANGSDPIRVAGNLTLEIGANWDTYADWIIDGNCIIGYSATLDVLDGTHFLCNTSLTLDSELYILNNSMVTVHGMLNFNIGGFMVVDNSTFICDYSLPSGWIDILGGIDMVSGSIEFPDANISIGGGTSILGGTIIAGRSVVANVGGTLLPIGGTLKLVGSAAGHYIQITNSNHLNDLVVNRSAPIGIHPGSTLIIGGSVNVNSEFMLQGNSMTVFGDLDINGGGGILNLNDNSVLAMADNRWLAVNSGGTLEAMGSAGNRAIITHNTGYYHFWTGNGCTIRAEHAVFEYMDHDGVLLNPGAFIDPAYSFDNCTFRNGFANGRLLTINSDQNFTVTDAVFPANTWNGDYNVYKDVDVGSVNFINATGAFSGESYEYDPNNRIHWGAPEVRLDLTVFLEGPFNGTNMNTDVNTVLPLNHPFDPPLPYFGNPLPPDWYYTGGGSVGSIPGSTIVDWVLVQLRDATSPGTALPATAIDTVPAFVLNNGNVVGLDGSSLIPFSVTPVNNLYAVIWHRNHLGIISANPLIETGGIYSYDFSSSASQAYGGSSAQALLSSSPDIWGMMAGDGDGSGNVTISDKNNIWDLQSGTTGYLEGDYNMNTNVNNQDKNDYWLPNDGEGTYIPE